MVMTALANTGRTESQEFIGAQGQRLLVWAVFACACLAWLAMCLRAWHRQPRPGHNRPRWQRPLLALWLAALALALLSKPWRGMHPAMFWPTWADSVASLRTQWQDLDKARRELGEEASQRAPVGGAGGADTLVMGISDSIDRRHLALYGYPRQTSPRLQQEHNEEPDRLWMFRHAWSVDASTVPALQNFFYFGQASGEKQHLLALVAAAGYQTWWISNQDDVAIEQEHARMAQHMRMINHRPGRASPSLDHHSLPALEQALRSPVARKLIVLHLMGAHPDYKRRYMQDEGRFEGVKDEVYEALKAQGRPAWVRRLRNDYDSALHYHDAVVAQSLALTRQWGGKAVWMFFSDHGQDVGSSGNRAGHSKSTAEGYRIPLLIWGHRLQAFPEDLGRRPVRSDWLGHSVMHLLDIRWPAHAPDKDVLDPRYRWSPPTTPSSVASDP